jgi:hypothetical protein
MKKGISLLVVLLISCFAFADVKSIKIEEDNAIANLTRSDNIPEESVAGVTDNYFEGYLQALVDMHYYEYRVIVIVKDHNVWLANLTKNKVLAKSIIAFLKDVPGVKDVKVLDGVPPKEIARREEYVARPHLNGIWFPQQTELFQPLIASPRQVIYSIGYRGGDKVVGRTAVAVSMGDDFPLFRWLDVLGGGDMQLGIEAGIWSVFNMKVKGDNRNGGTELFNTDYYVGIPLTYMKNQWSYRLRVYHISSHLGDEFMVNHPDYATVPLRVNPSFESLDFFFSYQASDIFRLYAGGGIILHSDDSFPMDRFYVEYGAEARFWGTRIYYHKLYGNFFAGAHLRNWQVLHWDYDGTYVFGYEWSKLQGVGRKIRIFGEYHHGFSLEGQFFKKRTTYGSIKVAYGF